MHWFYDPALTVSSVRLPEQEAKHVKSLRLEVDEEIAITNGLGLVLKARHQGDSDYQPLDNYTVQEPKPRFHLVQALAKGDRDEMALQASVELGVSSVTPLQSERSVVRWDGKAEKNRERWQQIALSAMKQSQQAHLCVIKELQTTKTVRPVGLGLVLDPAASQTISSVSFELDDITLVVGPEGGLSDAEIQKLSESGFTPVRLGTSVLRTSTAGPAAIAALMLAVGAWD